MRLSYLGPQESDRSPQGSDKPPLFIGLLVKMKTNGVSPCTIRNTDKALSHLARHTNLLDPEVVKTYIAQKPISEGYKQILCIAYAKFAKFTNIKWEKPKYKENAKAIKIPTKEKVEKLIARAKTHYP